MRNLSNECRVTAPEEAIKRAARVEAALEAALEKAPQTRNFLEEELPRASISCQAGFEPGGVHDDARMDTHASTPLCA